MEDSDRRDAQSMKMELEEVEAREAAVRDIAPDLAHGIRTAWRVILDIPDESIPGWLVEDVKEVARILELLDKAEGV